MGTHPIGGKAYVRTFLALLVLTGVSVALSFVSLGWLGPVLAFGIAAAKGGLVLLFFMHIYESRFVLHLVVLTLALFIALICLGVVADVGMR